MQNQFTAPTIYFLQEGRENLRECLKAAFQAAKQQNVSKIVIFTAKGEGVRIALESFCSQPEFSQILVIAVTFPAGKRFTDSDGNVFGIEIPAAEVEYFTQHRVPIVRAHLPLDAISPFYSQRGHLGQDLSLVGEALNMFCGSMSLCVQAVIMACDAGFVDIGEHVIALTSDTAILAQASPTARMLGEFIIREILCKPAVLSVCRKEVAEQLQSQMQLVMSPPAKELPPTSDAASDAPEEGAPDREKPRKGRKRGPRLTKG